MRVLLVHPPCGPRTIGLRHIAKMEPLGLETVGAGVSSQHDVRLVDMMVRPADLPRTLGGFTPDVAGVTSEMARTGPARRAADNPPGGAGVFDGGGRPSADDHTRGVQRPGRGPDRPRRGGRSVCGNLCGAGGGRNPLRPDCRPDDPHVEGTYCHRAPPAAARHQPPTAARPVAYRRLPPRLLLHHQAVGGRRADRLRLPLPLPVLSGLDLFGRILGPARSETDLRRHLLDPRTVHLLLRRKLLPRRGADENAGADADPAPA